MHPAVEAAGRIDILVNNAGFGVVGAIEETSEAELRNAMEVMFFGPLELTRLVLPQMRARRSGTVVQVTSMGGILSFPGVGAYSAAKGALELASEALAGEVAPLGVKVLIVEPGAFRTGFAGPATLQAAESRIADYDATAGATRDGLPTATRHPGGRPGEGRGGGPGGPGMEGAAAAARARDDAVDEIRRKLAAVGADIDATEHLGRAMSA